MPNDWLDVQTDKLLISAMPSHFSEYPVVQIYLKEVVWISRPSAGVSSTQPLRCDCAPKSLEWGLRQGILSKCSASSYSGTSRGLACRLLRARVKMAYLLCTLDRVEGLIKERWSSLLYSCAGVLKRQPLGCLNTSGDFSRNICLIFLSIPICMKEQSATQSSPRPGKWNGHPTI